MKLITSIFLLLFLFTFPMAALSSEEDNAAYKNSKNINTLKAYEQYLNDYPEGGYRQNVYKEMSNVIKVKNKKKRVKEFNRLVKKYPEALKYLPREYKILFYGPNDLKIHKILSLLKKGTDSKKLAIKIAGSGGKYKKLTKKEKEALKKRGATLLVMSTISQYKTFRNGPKELRLHDIIKFASSGESTTKTIERILSIERGKYKKFKKKDKELLKKLGIKKGILDAMAGARLFKYGPENLKVNELVLLSKKGISDDTLMSRIDKSGGKYRVFKEEEFALLQNLGLSDTLISNMLFTTIDIVAIEKKETIAMRKERDKERALRRERQKGENVQLAQDEQQKVVDYQSGRQQNRNMNSYGAYTSNKTNNSGNGGQGSSAGKKDSLGKTLGSCAAGYIAKKLCDKTPFPLNLACNALAKKKFKCLSK